MLHLVTLEETQIAIAWLKTLLMAFDMAIHCFPSFIQSVTGVFKS